MSLFLGKIHYWVFNKIVWFEKLERDIIASSQKAGINIDEIHRMAVDKYGDMLPNEPLENMIDQSNIHGWLQSKITSAEGRMAFTVREILNADKNNISLLNDVFVEQGIKAADEVKEENDCSNLNAEQVYNAMNDYVLDGMPCDRTTEVISSDENSVKWIIRLCVHESLWGSEQISVDYFYDLRDLWIKNFVHTLNENFNYVKQGEKTYSIERKM